MGSKSQGQMTGGMMEALKSGGWRTEWWNQAKWTEKIGKEEKMQRTEQKEVKRENLEEAEKA